MIDMHEMFVNGLAWDIGTQSPVVILAEVGQKDARLLPIWIGQAEATAIATRMANFTFKRPMTHDLIKQVIDGFDGKVIKVVINDLRDQTFYAKIYVERENSLLTIDARPSDSIALALRCDAPIYVANHVLEADREKTGLSDEDRAQNLRERLKEIDPEDFGKFSLE
jgi:bifunctional DNase/RNase